MNEDGQFPRLPGEHDIFLLRVWHESDGERAVWRASVLRGNSPRRYFSTPDALLHFLDEHLRSEPAGDASHAEV